MLFSNPPAFGAAMLVFVKVVHAPGDHGTDEASKAAEGQDPPPSLEVLVHRCPHGRIALRANKGGWVENHFSRIDLGLTRV